MYFKIFTAGLIASMLSNSIEAVALLGRPAPIVQRSNDLSCGQIYILGFPVPNCNSEASVFAPIRSTNNHVIPLPWTIPETTPLPLAIPDVKSIRYMGITNATGCHLSPPLFPTQYFFYNRDGQYRGAAYLKAGQNGRGCADFNGGSVVSYDGADMLVPMPEGLTGVGQ
ncbi:hypothetical protein DL98DRAFT_536101 [Cadophora sp. DSE1049]|nr:hypothetical protein DL98DRAFT_536101 [Cadophora sp. DSE1049]